MVRDDRRGVGALSLPSTPPTSGPRNSLFFITYILFIKTFCVLLGGKLHGLRATFLPEAEGCHAACILGQGLHWHADVSLLFYVLATFNVISG